MVEQTEEQTRTLGHHVKAKCVFPPNGSAHIPSSKTKTCQNPLKSFVLLLWQNLAAALYDNSTYENPEFKRLKFKVTW